MTSAQPGILAPVPPAARFMEFSLEPDIDPRGALTRLRRIADGDEVVVGFGLSLVQALDAKIDGLTTFPVHVGHGLAVPSTPSALWCWLRMNDRGDLVHKARTIEEAVGSAFQLDQIIDSFKYKSGLDLTGYEDGTENPEDDAAIEAGLVQGRGPGLDGSSFVAVQQWAHDLDHFQAMPGDEQDRVIGRRKSDNEEMDDAPASAHVKRTAQESFDPEAFVLRRSMPWASPDGEGLVFIAFGKSFDAFAALLNRMVGAEDGISDALFRFTQPVTGMYFWCPPMADGRLDLTALGLSPMQPSRGRG